MSKTWLECHGLQWPAIIIQENYVLVKDTEVVEKKININAECFVDKIGKFD